MTLPALPWLKIGGAALIAFAIWQYGNGRYADGRETERAKWEALAQDNAATIADLRVANAQREASAANAYAARLESMDPIIIRSTDTVTRYAQTPAGAAQCLAADRVLDIDATAAALGLGPAEAIGAGVVESTVQPDADNAER